MTVKKVLVPEVVKRSLETGWERGQRKMVKAVFMLVRTLMRADMEIISVEIDAERDGDRQAVVKWRERK